MTYKETLREFAHEYGRPVTVVKKFFEDFVQFTQDKLVEGETVRIKNFTTFSVREDKNYSYFDFQKNEPYRADRKIAIVTLSDNFKDLMGYMLNG